MDDVTPHLVSARRRMWLCAGVGVVVGLLTFRFTPWQLAVLVGWNVATITLLWWVFREILPADAAQTKAWAAPEDNSRRGTGFVVTVAAVFSLAGMAFGLVKARTAGQPLDALLTIAAVLAVVFSWSVVHTMYALRYAHLYYRDSPGGIDFHDEESLPDYRDFGYLAFTIGMSFAVSDPDIKDRAIRRTVTEHALVSYVFGAVIVGVTINVMAGFVR
jgi:uncharacterized membrane protein